MKKIVAQEKFHEVCVISKNTLTFHIIQVETILSQRLT